MASLFSTVLKYFVEFLGVAITYLAAAKLSLALASVHPSATPDLAAHRFRFGSGVAARIPYFACHLRGGIDCECHNRRLNLHVSCDRYREYPRKCSRHLPYQSMV